MESKDKVSRSRDKLKTVLAEEVTKMFEKVLDFADVAIPTRDTYKQFRSKVLRIGNNTIRNLQKEVENYEVKWTPKVESEDIIEVITKPKTS